MARLETFIIGVSQLSDHKILLQRQRVDLEFWQGQVTGLDVFNPAWHVQYAVCYKSIVTIYEKYISARPTYPYKCNAAIVVLEFGLPVCFKT